MSRNSRNFIRSAACPDRGRGSNDASPAVRSYCPRSTRSTTSASSSTKARRVGLVGESGCGKSTLVRALTRLIDISAGSVKLGDRELSLTAARDFAGDPDRARIQMVFQDAGESVNPRFTALRGDRRSAAAATQTARQSAARAGRNGGRPMRPAAATVDVAFRISCPAASAPASASHAPSPSSRPAGAGRADRGARRIGPGRDPAIAAAAEKRIRHELSVRVARSFRGAAAVRPRAW